MRNMSDWRDRNDLELTSEDVGQMLDAGQAVEASGPHVPCGHVVEAVTITYGAAWTSTTPGVHGGTVHTTQQAVLA